VHGVGDRKLKLLHGGVPRFLAVSIKEQD
jgi:hypothetical protein